MNRKHPITILAAIAIIGILVVSSFFTQLGSAINYNADNMVVNGVLSSDSYVLYPYEHQDLMFGFSKYGELINGVAKQGLEYDGLDVFANPNVLEKDWSQGWVIDIHYADISNNYKRAWAFALYADQSGSAGIGGDWVEACTGNPDTSPQHGGRRTNVWATTDPIKVLYDGPRRFVALTRTVLYDGATKTADNALVSITITLEFNKDKKEVILFKDIKRLDEGKFGRLFQVEFSNRGEWDIGTVSAPPSYANFYHNMATLYDYHYHAFYSAANPITGYDVCQMIDQDGTYAGFVAYWPQLFGKLVDGTTHITRAVILNSLCTITQNATWDGLTSKAIVFGPLGWPTADPYPIGGGIFGDEPLVYKNSILLTGGGVDYTWNGATDTITLTTLPVATDYMTIVYKHSVNSGSDDMIAHAGHEPDTPYVIGEWCFDLKNEPDKKQFRGVSVYGLTDRHNADDNDAALETWSLGANVIDDEVSFMLNEIFNPYDLYSAVEPLTYRWVDIRNVTVATSTITVAPAPMVASPWDLYSQFAERVLVDGVLIDRAPYHLLRNYVETTHAPYYDINFATGAITFYKWDSGSLAYVPWVLPIGTHIKVLWSTIGAQNLGRYEWLVVGKNARTIDSAAGAYITEAFDSIKNREVEMMGMDIREADYGPNSPWVMSGAGTGTRTDYIDSLGRPHLRDDWCTKMPIASSNMIFMAGPRANLGTEYFNEFTNVFFARSEYVTNNTGQANKIMALSCWNKNTYTNGYGVISVYQDINGTIGLVFWGYNADDFYYTCKWFWSYPAGITCPDGVTVVYSGIEYLQHENRGVTDIILKITYPTADPVHPTVAVSTERLGTISEKVQHDP